MEKGNTFLKVELANAAAIAYLYREFYVILTTGGEYDHQKTRAHFARCLPDPYRAFAAFRAWHTRASHDPWNRCYRCRSIDSVGQINDLLHKKPLLQRGFLPALNFSKKKAPTNAGTFSTKEGLRKLHRILRSQNRQCIWSRQGIHC